MPPNSRSIFHRRAGTLWKKIRVALLALLLLSGCGLGGFDASGYVKASLDKIYPGKVAAYAKLMGSDKTQAQAEHKLDVQAEASKFLRYFGVAQVSGETMEAICGFFDALYQKSRYQVGKAVQVDENTLDVPVSVSPIAIYRTAAQDVNGCIAALRQRNENGEFRQLDEAAYGDVCALALLDALRPYLDKVEYLPEEQVTVRVRRGQGGWEIPKTELDKVDRRIIQYPER